MDPLKHTFLQLLANYSNDNSLANKLWQEIAKNYSNKKRHYHTLQHLDNLLDQLTEVKSAIQNWEAILFSLYYHDIIYDPLKSNNEEKSAELAEKRMNQLKVPAGIIALCKNHILASKSHTRSADSDSNYFTDADLSVLGQSRETYILYSKKVRKEYSIYPDLLYKPGRKKVLQHFLAMDSIFKTDFFYIRFEIPARQNIQYEIESL